MAESILSVIFVGIIATIYIAIFALLLKLDKKNEHDDGYSEDYDSEE